MYYLINKHFGCYAAALISVQDRTDKPIYTKHHIKLQLFNNSCVVAYLCRQGVDPRWHSCAQYLFVIAHWGLELWIDNLLCYCRHQTLCLHAFCALRHYTLIHSYFISQTTMGCYCQQIGGGGVSLGAMLDSLLIIIC